MRIRLRLSLTLPAMLAAALAACGGADPGPPVLSDLSIDKPSLKVNEIGSGMMKIADPDGDLANASIVLSYTYGMQTVTATAPLQNGKDDMTELSATFAYGLTGAAPLGQWTLGIKLFDSAKNPSNTLTTPITIVP